METVLMFADTLRSPDLRHVVPLGIGDPFIYAEQQGRRVAFLPSIEVPRARELDDLEVMPYEEIGLDELVAKGMRYRAARLELLARACEHLGLEEAVTPADFPLAAADFLRGRGVTLRSNDGFFVNRRRVKTTGELEGVRRAQAAAQIAMETMSNAIRRGGDISSESLRTQALREAAGSEAFFEYLIVAHGAQAASVHDSGSGPVAPGESIVIDLGVRDWKSGAWADMTRTFSFGRPSKELVHYQSICRLVLEQVTPMVRPGASCAEIYRRADSIIAEAGYDTLLTKKPGQVLESGFVHSLGHGVGLEIHEAPSVAPSGEDLVAGDLITLEPGVYRKGFGGVRLEDLILVTDDGCEVLTDFPYEL